MAICDSFLRISFSPQSVDWKNANTLLLAIAPGCELCASSAPFYRFLSKAVAQNSRLRLIALLPESASYDEGVFDSLSISRDRVRLVSLKTLAI